jgi:hypothetical protein
VGVGDRRWDDKGIRQVSVFSRKQNDRLIHHVAEPRLGHSQEEGIVPNRFTTVRRGRDGDDVEQGSATHRSCSGRRQQDRRLSRCVNFLGGSPVSFSSCCLRRATASDHLPPPDKQSLRQRTRYHLPRLLHRLSVLRHKHMSSSATTPSETLQMQRTSPMTPRSTILANHYQARAEVILASPGIGLEESFHLRIGRCLCQ